MGVNYIKKMEKRKDVALTMLLPKQFSMTSFSYVTFINTKKKLPVVLSYAV